jgi:hypothetical protein
MCLSQPAFVTMLMWVPWRTNLALLWLRPPMRQPHGLTIPCADEGDFAHIGGDMDDRHHWTMLLLIDLAKMC